MSSRPRDAILQSQCQGWTEESDGRDPDPSRRYKAFYSEHGGIDTFIEWEGRTIWGQGEGDGMWVSFSPDGVRWTNCPENPVIAQGSDTTQSLVWDPRLERCVVFGRMGAGGRRLGRAESPDAVHFTPPELVFAPDEMDEEGTQFYGMPLGLYEGLYLGMLWVYREGADGTIDTALACSRGGDPAAVPAGPDRSLLLLDGVAAHAARPPLAARSRD